jgi:hypothetical protein
MKEAHAEPLTLEDALEWADDYGDEHDQWAAKMLAAEVRRQQREIEGPTASFLASAADFAAIERLAADDEFRAELDAFFNDVVDGLTSDDDDDDEPPEDPEAEP